MTEVSSTSGPVTAILGRPRRSAANDLRPAQSKEAITVPPSPIVDDPVAHPVTDVVELLREAGIMTIRLHERHRPRMVALVVFQVGGRTANGSAALVFDNDHWAAGPNLPGAYFDYLGDRWTPPGQLVRSVLAILSAGRD